jgi:DNA-binding NtrC family response regulator
MGGFKLAKILIVDDEENIRMLMKEELEEAGFEVLTVANAKSALEKLSSEPDIDIVCTDIEMPDVNGLALASEIRKKYPNKKIIFLTAYSHYKSEMASWAGDAYVVKSMDLTEIKDTIENLLKIQ